MVFFSRVYNNSVIFHRKHEHFCGKINLVEMGEIVTYLKEIFYKQILVMMYWILISKFQDSYKSCFHFDFNINHS